MKETKFVKLSQDHRETQRLINEAILKIDTSMKVSFLTDLCKVTDPNKYMLVYEHSLGLASIKPSIGVKVVEGSQNMAITEERLNTAMSMLRDREDLNFINISIQKENTYIILFEYKSGTFPFVKILPVIEDAYNAEGLMNDILQELDDDEYFGLQPFDSFMINTNNMIMLFG